MPNPLVQNEEEIRGLLESGVADRVFPGAVALIGAGQSTPLCVAAGSQTYDDGAPSVGPRTLFDMASLTKVLVTTTAILQMVDQGCLTLSDTAEAYLTPFCSGDKGGITLRHLLTHTSGLSADISLLKLGDDWSGVDQAALWETIHEEPLQTPPGERYLYSDLGFLLLGRILELVSGSTLGSYAETHIFNPLAMNRTRYCPPTEWWPEAAPTEYDTRWRGGLLQGRVHDEKAFLLRGVAGHAGLFSTAEDLYRFARALLDCLSEGSQFVVSETIARAMTEDQTPTLPVRQGLGWFLDPAFLGGLRPHAFGHTGFTGVSLAASPLHSVICILLTNCVYPHRPEAATRQRLNAIRARLADIALRMSLEMR